MKFRFFVIACVVLFVAPVCVAFGQAAESDLVSQTAAAPEVVNHMSPLELVLAAGPVVKFVMFLLTFGSVVTWGIVFQKVVQFRSARSETKEFSEVFFDSRSFSQISEASGRLLSSPVAAVYRAAHRELMQMLRTSEGGKGLDQTSDLDNIDRALKRAKAEEVTRLERGTTFLATTASAAPFIGLFGTVWGIMDAFIGLSHTKTSSIQAVAPGIAEALIATAIGLVAAIPAAIAYNYFSQQIRILSRSMDMFAAEFLNIARRQFIK